MSTQLERAKEYIERAGGSVSVKAFDEDHEPIGPVLRFHLLDRGYTRVEAGVVFLKVSDLTFHVNP